MKVTPMNKGLLSILDDHASALLVPTSVVRRRQRG
jgi:hypothetical protein